MNLMTIDWGMILFLVVGFGLGYGVVVWRRGGACTSAYNTFGKYPSTERRIETH